MKLFAPLAQAIRPAPVSFPVTQQHFAQPQQGYLNYSRAYMNNEIVFSAIEMLATSAGEPHIIGRRFRRARPEIRNEERRLLQAGIPRREAWERMIEAGFHEDLPNHALVKLLEQPNPWLSRGQMWGTVVMDRALAGNSYWLKARSQGGPMKGAIAELWRLRPDRVRIIPSQTKFIEGYEYSTGNDKTLIPPEDILHFKTRHPLNDYYGMPPLMVIAGRIDIDDYMKGFLRDFYEGGGTGPAAILTSKQKLSPESKQEIEERVKARFGHRRGVFEWLVLDSTESTYQNLGLNRGLRDALPKEIDAVSEARIAMAFGIPGSILGLLIGYESSSYANKRQDWQVFWDLTMTPLLSDLDDALNLQLTPNYQGIDEVLFDLSDIRALQEDVDKVHERHRNNIGAGVESWEEAREAIGLDPKVKEGIFFIPPNTTPVKLKDLAEEPEPVVVQPPPRQLPERTETEGASALVSEVHCPVCNRWVGRNMNVGAVAYCPKDKEVLVTLDMALAPVL